MQRSWGFGACVAIGGLFLSISGARANFISNAGLTPNVKVNQYGMVSKTITSSMQPLTGWTASGAIDVIPKSYWQTTGTSGWSVDLIGTGGLGAISQTVSGLSIGATYEFTFDFAPDPEKQTNERGTTKRLQVTIDGSDQASPAEYSAVAAADATKKNMNYQHETIAFVATNSDVTLTLEALTPLNVPTGKSLDKLRCGPVISNLGMELISSGGSGNPQTPTPVPEPASLGALGLGALSMLRRRRRRA